MVHAENISLGFGDGTIVAKSLVVEPLKKGAPLRVGSVEATNVRFPAMMRDLDVTPHAHVNWVYKTTHVPRASRAPWRRCGSTPSSRRRRAISKCSIERSTIRSAVT